MKSFRHLIFLTFLPIRHIEIWHFYLFNIRPFGRHTWFWHHFHRLIIMAKELSSPTSPFHAFKLFSNWIYKITRLRLIFLQHSWGYLRRSVIEKTKNSKKSGAGGSILTKLDNIVLDIIGRETALMNGIKKDKKKIIPGSKSFGGNNFDQSFQSDESETDSRMLLKGIFWFGNTKILHIVRIN